MKIDRYAHYITLLLLVCLLGNGSLVVPVGLAFERSTNEENGIVLRMEDEKHPTPAGSYLAACTFYAALFGESPLRHPYTAGLDLRTAWTL